MLALTSDRGRIFEKASCDGVMAQLQAHDKDSVVCTDVKLSDTRRPRPQPLNTVELLKRASKGLGIGPQAAMRAAEYLYLSGYLSYPRTESTAYPSSFDFRDVLQSQRGHCEWGGYAALLLSQGHTPPRQGFDAGDHPPITPVGLAQPHELGLSSDNARIYDLVVRHFLASISPDAKFEATRARFLATSSKETFTLRGKREKDPGFLRIYQQSSSSYGRDGNGNREEGGEGDYEGEDEGGETMDMPELEIGKTYRIASLKSRQGATTAPGYLSESDLISRMEKHGIGTDASIPTHINNILVRNYVALGSGRTLVPTELGVVLVHGYQRIDPQLVLPETRAAIERACDSIAKGHDSKEEVRCIVFMY